MADIIHIEATIEQDGEVHVANLPVERGQRVELSIRLARVSNPDLNLTAGQLLASDLVGVWQDRADVGDSSAFARELRKRAQHRQQPFEA